jgi:hypothetical protein
MTRQCMPAPTVSLRPLETKTACERRVQTRPAPRAYIVLPMTPNVRHVAPDGIEIRLEGVRPVRGGSRGAPAVDVNGRKRCASCLTLLPDDHGRSPYCEDCRRDAIKKAWQTRNDKRRSAAVRRRELQQQPHWEGNGYIHGRSGLYIDATLLSDLRTILSGLLSSHTSWAEIANQPYDPNRASQYQHGLRDMLRAVADANDALRGPFFPRTDGRARRRTEDEMRPAR